MGVCKRCNKAWSGGEWSMLKDATIMDPKPYQGKKCESIKIKTNQNSIIVVI
jgi:hypothetical protein